MSFITIPNILFISLGAFALLLIVTLIFKKKK